MSEIKTDQPPTQKAKDDLSAPLVQRMTQVFKEAMEQELTVFKAKLQEEREKIIKENEELLEKALRTSLGVDKDLPVTQSQIREIIRKALLEETESQKRTPAPTEKAGPDGNKKPDPFDEMMKQKGLVEAA